MEINKSESFWHNTSLELFGEIPHHRNRYCTTKKFSLTAHEIMITHFYIHCKKKRREFRMQKCAGGNVSQVGVLNKINITEKAYFTLRHIQHWQGREMLRTRVSKS
jgi:hypothetical protein